MSAYKKARRGTRKNQENLHFFYNLEWEIIRLQKELISQSYQPGGYRFFTIKDPKQRLIAVAPFRDRVVHHALIHVLEPIFERIFIYDSYATRKGKGTHLAIRRAQHFLRKQDWFYKADIQKYFDNIGHSRLLALIARKIKDPLVLDLCERIFSNGGQAGKGLPIGNLTSQFFANVYLDPFDHFVKENLGLRGYLRYMDDFVLFRPDKDDLKKDRKAIKGYLADYLHLTLKPKACFFNRAGLGLPFLGMRIFARHIRPQSTHLRRIMKKYQAKRRAWQEGSLSEEELVACGNSYFAHLSHYNTYQFRLKKML